jgi:hypothetical protein
MTKGGNMGIGEVLDMYDELTERAKHPMGTKKNPGKFDCYANAKDDEPMFILLGRDPAAACIVRCWIALRNHLENCGAIQKNEQQTIEALELADKLEQYARDLGKGNQVNELREVSISPMSVRRWMFKQDI